MSHSRSQTDVGILIRRCLFFMLLITLTAANLFVMFRGLSSPQGMDQAQISREISRGNGFTTKMIRPVAYAQAIKAKEHAVPLAGFKDTYHSPLNPLINAVVFKLVGADDPSAWQMVDEQLIYPLDRVVAAVSTIFFLFSIGVSYLLIARIFDAKIAGVCAIIMLFCEVLWNYSLSGLPQMLMLFLFSCGMYFVYRAVEAVSEERVAMVPALLAGLFFTLLAFTHWVAVWIALGYIIFAAFTFRPRGLLAAAVLLLLMGSGAFVIFRNFTITGSPFGTAFLTLYNGIGSGAEEMVMRTSGEGELALQVQGLARKVLSATLLQSREIIPLLAGIVVAPLFFLSLLHPFKSKPIATFRWAILTMWAVSALGLAFFGISTEPLDPNQTHLLFAPLMTAYGVAMVSILWTRLDFVIKLPALRELHLIVIVIICALPLALNLPERVRVGMMLRDRGGYPLWPPYYAPALAHGETGIRAWVEDDQVVFSDQPWAVAWYADRISVWLPPTREDFIEFETICSQMQTPLVGILTSPSSTGERSALEVSTIYQDFAALVLNGVVMRATYPPGVAVYNQNPRVADIISRYPHMRPMVGLNMMYYSDRPIRAKEPN